MKWEKCANDEHLTSQARYRLEKKTFKVFSFKKIVRVEVIKYSFMLFYIKVIVILGASTVVWKCVLKKMW